jgi:outer membrane cobalamin receptor
MNLIRKVNILFFKGQAVLPDLFYIITIFIFYSNLLQSQVNTKKDTSSYKIIDSIDNYKLNGSIKDSLSNDSIKIVKSKEVTIIGNGFNSNNIINSQSNYVITKSNINNTNSNTLGDVLKLSSGVSIRDYGGACSLQTLSIRGSLSQQNVILLDGIKYTSSSNDAFDLSNLPIFSIERIEIYKGASASKYGSNSIGGVVNILTLSKLEKSISILNKIEAGSFGEKSLSTNISVKLNKKNNIQTIGGYRYSKGDYPFTFNEFGKTIEFKRENSQYENIFGSIIWNNINESWNFKSSIYGFIKNKGVPGAVVQGNREQSEAKLNEHDIFFTFSATNKNLFGTNTNLYSSLKINKLDYKDPELKINLNGITTYRNELSIGAKSLIVIDEEKVIEWTFENNYSSIQGVNYLNDFEGRIKRNNLGLSISSDINFHKINTYLDFGMRYDLFSDFPPTINPSVGLLITPFNFGIKFKVRLATAFRAPSFSEQYYLNYGNRNLLPEKSLSIDVGTSIEYDSTFYSEINLFNINTNNQIVSIPKSAIAWSAQNITKVLNQGFEFTSHLSLFDSKLLAQVSYTLMRSLDKTDGAITYNNQIIYSPNEIFSGTLTTKINDLTISFISNYQSHSYFLPINLPEYSLDRFFLFGSNVRYNLKLFGINCDIKLECSNIFDSQYFVVKNYPMPSRSFKVSLDNYW